MHLSPVETSTRVVCDPISLEIVRGAIAAARAEMEALLERTAISAGIREKKDFFTALFDADGVMAVGSNVPLFGDMTTPVFEKYPVDEMKPGDLFWYSDCYGSRGAVSHSNDQVLLAPVFHDGKRCAFVMCWAHFADIGGIRPGSISPDATDNFQEGIIIPVTRLSEGGRLNQAALEIFHRNSRFPDESEGDMRALMASVELGVRRVREIMERFGVEVVSDAFAQLLARTRNLVRKRLAESFDYGTHRFTDSIDGDGHGNGPFKLRFAMTRERGGDGEDRFIFDATESDDQAVGPINYLMNVGVPGIALGLYYLGGDSSQINNAGGPNAIDEVRLREGSILLPKFPAALGMRGLTMMRVFSSVTGLINAAGGNAAAGNSSYVVATFRGTFRTETGGLERFLLGDGIGVGYGARPDSDGIDAVYFVAQENYPVEFLEAGYPVRLRAYGIAEDSGGPGRFRGGCGILRDYEIMAEDVMLSLRISGVSNPPWGFDGGMSGGIGRAIVNPGTDRERVLKPLSDGNRLVRGDILRVATGGGGGHGHPYDRALDAVLEDVLGGFVSREAAERHYGVVFDGNRIDEAATTAHRSSRPAVRRFHRQEYVDALA
ncbi:hydantoinase B/oxoprolinase family protein [Mesorhizobium sp. CAU 1741]|uniref:hydantoinase B/oxoprolinase family protein n=1 Tax=Mesorhizobium sp. CAU 1741 TaxID=3140366 RepID=UPI00325AD7E7